MFSNKRLYEIHGSVCLFTSEDNHSYEYSIINLVIGEFEVSNGFFLQMKLFCVLNVCSIAARFVYWLNEVDKSVSK